MSIVRSVLISIFISQILFLAMASAQLRCENVFQVSKVEFRPRHPGDVRYQRNRFMRFLLDFSILKEKNRGKKALVKLAEDYIAEVQKDLESNGVEVELLEYPYEGTRAKALFIKQDSDSSPLNRMAKGIWRRYGAKLMFAPFELAFGAMKGYVISHKGVTYYSMSGEMIATLKPDSNFIHEMIHVRMDRLDKFASPHIFLTEFFAEKHFDNAELAGYQKFFRQDELLAYNKQIAFVAAKFRTSHPRFFRDLRSLNQDAEKMSPISRRIISKERQSQALVLGEQLRELVEPATLLTEEAYNLLSELPMALEMLVARKDPFTLTTGSYASMQYFSARIEMEVWGALASVKVQIEDFTIEFRIPNRHAEKKELSREEWRDLLKDLSTHVGLNLKEVTRNRDLLAILAKAINQKDMEVILEVISSLRRDL